MRAGVNIIKLNAGEREKFVAYLEQEATTEKGLIEQMERMEVHENIVKHLKLMVLACDLISDRLRRTEDMKI